MGKALPLRLSPYRSEGKNGFTPMGGAAHCALGGARAGVGVPEGYGRRRALLHALASGTFRRLA